MPVTLEAAENAPMRSGRSAYWTSRSCSTAVSMWPSRSSGMVTTSQMDSRQGSSFEWCSNGPMKTTGRSSAGIWADRPYFSSRSAGMRRLRMPISLSIAAVAAGAAEDHDRVVVAAHGVPDDPSRVLAEPGRLQPGAAGLGVGVGIARQDLAADEVLDEGQGPAAPGAAEDHHRLVVAADGVPDQPAGVLTQPGGLQPGAAGLGVRVGVPRQDLGPRMKSSRKLRARPLAV